MGEIFQLARAAQPLEFTGERLTSSAGGQIEIEHLHRYFLAREFCRGKDVLDVASGEGYGSALLGQVARSVVGVEIAPEVVFHAASAYRYPNLRFLAGDARNLPLRGAAVDVVVSFETIEHFLEHDRFLQEVRRVLRPGGLLIVSSPDRDTYSPSGTSANPYHPRELSKAEFLSLLGGAFTHVACLTQRPMMGSAMLLEGASGGPALTFERRGAHHFETNTGLLSGVYVVALASDQPISPPLVSFHIEMTHFGMILQELDARTRALNAIESSISWRMTARLRSILDHHPRLRRLVRRGGRFAWRIVTLQLPRWLAKRRQLRSAGWAPALRQPRAGGLLPEKLKEIEEFGLFDREWYLAQNPHIRSTGIDPLAHYLWYGAAEGRSPSPLFNTPIYVAAHRGQVRPEDALLHFHRSGLDVAPGAYRTPDVLVDVQHRYQANTEMRCLRDRRSRERRFVVYLQCGAGSVHHEWLKGSAREWDLIVNHYDGTYVDRVPCDVEFQQVGPLPGTKFTSFLTLLTSWPDLVRQYDAVLLLDDDVLISEAGIDALFNVVESYSLDLAQPSLTTDSHCAHPVCRRRGARRLRYVNAIDLMMPVYSRRSLEVGGHLFKQTVSGWGLDMVLGKLVSERLGGKAAVVDAVAARHSKPIDTQGGAFYMMLHRAGIYPEIELTHLQRLHGVGRDILELSAPQV